MNKFSNLFLPASLFLAIGSVALASCTPGAVYRNIQQDQQRLCRQLPVPQQAHCLSQHEVPYEEYKRQRDAIEPVED